MKIFIIGLLLAVTSCERYNDPATYIVPKGNMGPLTVIYSQRMGQPATFRDGRRFYAIPGNGVLMTQFDYQGGWRDDLFLMKSDRGYDTLNAGNTSSVSIGYHTFRMFYPKLLDPDKKHNLDSGFMYEILYVCKTAVHPDTIYVDSMDRLDRKATQLVEAATKNPTTFK